MPTFIETPTVVPSVGTRPKRIEEYVGRVNSGTALLSVARMQSPEGWVEPAQRPAFTEVTLVLAGCLSVVCNGEVREVRAGQAVITHPGETIRYSTPHAGGAEYVAVCVPAFSPDTVHRLDDPGTSP